MRKVIKQTTKIIEQSITVCDTCGGELKNINISVIAYSNCDEGCCETHAHYEFCSYNCFIKLIPQLRQEFDDDSDYQTYNIDIKLSSDGTGTINNILDAIMRGTKGGE